MNYIESEAVPYQTSSLPKRWSSSKCIWCPEKILKNEMHWHFAGYFEGDKQNWRMHTECFLAFQKTHDQTDGNIYNHAHKRGDTEIDENSGYY